MRLLLSIAAVIALATAELYKENEDFQYSRSSSDEGHKEGFYGAQRGNMGGNYEKAHNMDPLAQHQMSGVVRQVEGELGDGANTRSGNVFSSSNSRGIYGSGRYDTSNLAGRNFNEGVNYGDSRSHSSLSSHNAHSQYAGQSSRHSGYTGSSGLNSGYHSGALQSGNLQAIDSVGAGGYDYAHNAEHSSGYETKSGYTKHSSSGYGSNAGNAQIRLVGNGQPARVVIRPGTTIYVPVAAQTYQHESLHDQNSINSDAEVLSSADHHAHYVPSTDAKSYESSYSYRKEWEKHHGYPYPSAVPLAVPTYPKNSELYEDSQASSGSHKALSSSHYDNSNSHVKSSSAMQSHHHSGYNAAHDSASSLYSNANTHGSLNSDIGYAGDVGSKPKSYQSSYAYHKSWERQGDPYVIIPGSDGQSGKVIDASDQNGYTKGGKLCCVDSEGHIRVARSYNENQEAENLNQQSQTLEDLGQQTQDLTQQETSNWNGHLEDFGQQTQDLTQQSQNNWNQNLEDFGQQTQDLTQQTQNNWNQNLENLGQQTQDLTQQTQNNWNQNLENLGQQTQDLTQQTQNNWNQNLEGLGQQTQDLTQQSQNNWNQNKEDFGQQTQDLGQGVNRWDKLTDPGQQTESQQSQDTRNMHTLGHDDFGQQSQNKWELGDFGQTGQGSWHHNMDSENTTREKQLHTNLDNFHQSTLNLNNSDQQNNWHQATQNQEHFGQETQGMWHKIEESKHNMSVTLNSQEKPVWEQTEDNRPQSNIWKFLENDHQNTNTNQQTNGKNSNERIDSTSHGTSIVNLWDKINNLDQFSTSDNNNNQNGYQHSHSQSSVDNSFQNNWSHSYSQSSDSGMTQQSTYMQNHYGTHYGEFKPMWSSDNINQKSSTEQPKHNFARTDNLTQNSNSFGGYQGKESTTIVRPGHNNDTTVFEGSRAQDVGRGDIGPEESSIDDPTTNTKLDIYTNHDQLSPSTVSYAFENKRYKTPEEIETLSLTTQTEKIGTNKDNSVRIKNVTEFNNQQESENTLSVVSIEEWRNEERKHDKNQYDSSGTFATTPKSGSAYNTNHQQIESHKFGSQSESTLYYNKPTTSTSVSPVSVPQNKPKDVADRTPKDLKDLHEEQGTEDMAQQTQQLGDFGSFVQEHKNFDQELDQQNQQQFKNLGQFGQQTDNSDQQVQSSWGHDLVDLGQQQQSGWNSRDQVQETQQLEKSGTLNEGQYQTQDFYNERYTHGKEEKESSRKIEDLQSPQSPQTPQTILEQKTEAETAATPVTSTEKSGFWKSVGSKFSSAKDTVSTWFKRS